MNWRTRSRSARADDARRARLILMLSADRSYSEIAAPWIAMRATSAAGRGGFWLSVWRDCIRATPAGRSTNGRRAWKQRFWSGPDAGRATARPTGAAANWAQNWGLAT